MSELFASHLRHDYETAVRHMVVPVEPASFPSPRVVMNNDLLAVELGIKPSALTTDSAAQILSGNQFPTGATPVAQAYSGHQFGQYNPLMGDGRAMVLGEWQVPSGELVDIALKGSGRTPFSQGGDGRCALGPALREFIVSEAMASLEIPTTRSLAVTNTGDTIYRSTGEEQGAVLTRVASSHLRVGTFQLARAHGSTAQLQALADYAIARHVPTARTADSPYLTLLKYVLTAQAHLVARWMSVGFIHGVMNTDNMTISGETIDYGPCAFLDEYDPQTVFSSIDLHGRYRYNQQPVIAGWNVARLAESLIPLIDTTTQVAVEQVTSVLDDYSDVYNGAHFAALRAKLALPRSTSHMSAHQDVLARLFALMEENSLDYTLTWRAIAADLSGEDAPQVVQDVGLPDCDGYSPWRADFVACHAGRDLTEVAHEMDAANPLVIARNHLVENALQQARDGDYSLTTDLVQACRTPHAAPPNTELISPPPEGFTSSFTTFCGT